jgi:hypothetical protein
MPARFAPAPTTTPPSRRLAVLAQSARACRAEERRLSGQRQDAIICTVQASGFLGLGQGMADKGKANGFHQGSLAAGWGQWFSMLRGFGCNNVVD